MAVFGNERFFDGLTQRLDQLERENEAMAHALMFLLRHAADDTFHPGIGNSESMENYGELIEAFKPRVDLSGGE